MRLVIVALLTVALMTNSPIPLSIMTSSVEVCSITNYNVRHILCSQNISNYPPTQYITFILYMVRLLYIKPSSILVILFSSLTILCQYRTTCYFTIRSQYVRTYYCFIDMCAPNNYCVFRTSVRTVCKETSVSIYSLYILQRCLSLHIPL